MTSIKRQAAKIYRTTLVEQVHNIEQNDYKEWDNKCVGNAVGDHATIRNGVEISSIRVVNCDAYTLDEKHDGKHWR